jgi:hypothetical protein
VHVRAAGICAQTLVGEARAGGAGSVRRSLRHVAAVLARALCVARAALLALACGSAAPFVHAAAPSAMRAAALGGADGRLAAAFVQAAAPSAMRAAVLGGADGRLGAAVLDASLAASVRGAVLGGALGRLVAAVLDASLAASVRLAMRSAALSSALFAALVLAPPAASVRDAVLSAARHCALYALLVLAAAGHVHTAPAKPAPPPRRRERRALPVCLVYDVSHAVPRNASRTRGG